MLPDPACYDVFAYCRGAGVPLNGKLFATRLEFNMDLFAWIEIGASACVPDNESMMRRGANIRPGAWAPKTRRDKVAVVQAACWCTLIDH